ncbi:hypothetical protein FBT96_15960 [Rhodobacter capsulatus]|uniref:Uncharacterized protein n=1 Tax=Rhodobacter capsulatus TaxID=1061 RepID=A0A4V5PPL8_RHOCA|nr:hypothetical protein FBT96_15960 [Rhodobacter capsulatus]
MTQPRRRADIRCVLDKLQSINAVVRMNEEFRRRFKTQTVLPCSETVPMLHLALLASGQIQTRKAYA